MQRRTVRLLDTWEYAGWKIRVVYLSMPAAHRNRKLIEQAQAVTAAFLDAYPESDETQLGFLIINDGESVDALILGLWDHGSEQLSLHSSVGFEKDDGQTLQDLGDDERVILDPWEALIVGFEADAWIKFMEGESDDFRAYTDRPLERE
jgi:hypothetical protein